MKKLIAIFLIFFTFCIVSAQMDTEHWFAPMYNSTGSDSSLECYLYVSTDEVTPFNVNIYNDNNIITTLNIAKNQPAIYSIPYQYLFTNQANDVLKPLTKGIFVNGSKKFFANIRFQVPSHAEIITSKGKAALGNLFYSVNSPLPRTETYFNFSTSIIATENNTNIKVTNFKQDVVFFDNNSYTQLNVVLNKGESYIIAGTGNDTKNLEGFIGAKIESDKPIAVVNGNLGGSVSTNNNNSKDFYVDESVPTERLGNKFAVMKGNGDIGYLMEEPMILATKNNTQIYINDETTPYSFTKNGVSRNYLNEGEYTLIDEGKYKDKGNGVYNMSINTTQDVYIYQNLAGVSSGSIYATGGFNYIPPLNCFLPNKIDEIANINSIGSTTYDTKLNIITEKGAVVKLNGNILSGIDGPYSITGNNDWEMYSINNVTSNISINSTKSVTAGIAAGSGNVGYGGYFAGFNSIPVISKGGDCDLGNVRLEVDDSYDAFQWYFNGVLIPGETNYYITPTNSGFYTCEIIKLSCGTVTTPVFKFQRCPFKSTQNYIVPDCKPNIAITAPAFTTSTQAIDYSIPIKIVTNPSHGVLTTNPATGVVISYTLTDLLANTDTFSYSFTGIDPLFPDSEIVTVTIDVKHLNATNAELYRCYDVVNNNAVFNLNDAVITTDTNITSIDYFDNIGLIPTSIISNYTSVAKTIQAVLTNSYGCTKTVNIDLKYFPITNVNTITFNSAICDTDFDGLYELKFSTDVSPYIVTDYTKFNINYFEKNPLTNPGEPALSDDYSFSTATKNIYVWVTSKDGCSDYQLTNITFTAGTKLPVNNISVPICDNDRDGKETVKISDYVPSNYLYFKSRTDAENPSGITTTDSQEITTDTTFYIRTVDATFCPNIFDLHFIFKQPNVSTSIKDITICKDTSTEIDAGTGFTYYKWSNGQEGMGPTFQKQIYKAGNYFVELSSNGCVYKQYFAITEAPVPVVTVDVLGSTITVNATGGTPPYEYSLDKINWQTSNVFSGLSRGLQMVYVRDFYQCNPIEKQFSIINIINAITPNGDGINDVLDYSDLKIYKDVKISVYDRYGNTIYKNNSNSYIWDGTSNGRKIPTGTYWYIIEWTNPDTNKVSQYQGWILVKNR